MEALKHSQFYCGCLAVALGCLGFLGGSDSKESADNAGDLGSIPGSGRSSGEGNGSPSSILAWRVSGRSPGERNGSLLQYSCLENSMDRGAWLQSKGLQRVGNDWVTNSALVHMRACVLSHFSCVWLLVTLWTIACQARLSMRFSRQEY